MIRLPTRFSICLAGFALLLTIPLVLGFLGALHPFFDSFAHFRRHLAILTGLAALPLLATRFRLEAVVALALAFGAFATTRIESPAFGEQAEAASSAGLAPLATYRMLHLNLYYDNPTPGRVLSLIGREQPDVIALNEVSAAWRPSLALLAAAYPYRVVCATARRIGGVAILSRRPFARDGGACGDDGRYAAAAIDFGGRVIDIASVHLDWPWPFGQATQIERLSSALSGLGETAILAGDFNAAPWSEATSTMAAAGGFRIVGGIGPTWLPQPSPAGLARLIGLPIDQVLAKGRISAISAVSGDAVGSDHLPVIVTFTPMDAPPEPAGTLRASR